MSQADAILNDLARDLEIALLEFRVGFGELAAFEREIPTLTMDAFKKGLIIDLAETKASIEECDQYLAEIDTYLEALANDHDEEAEFLRSAFLQLQFLERELKIHFSRADADLKEMLSQVTVLSHSANLSNLATQYVALTRQMFTQMEADTTLVWQILRPIGTLKRVQGYVYLIKETTGHYKIGRTINPDDRMRTFSVKLSFKVEYEHLIPTNHMHRLESLIHHYFRDKRQAGEWFKLEDADVQWIKLINQFNL